MEIKIESIVIESDKIEAVVRMKSEIFANFKGADYYGLNDNIMRRVSEKLTADYLAKHTHEIMADIDKQQILNMIVLNSAGRIAGKDNR